MKSSLTCWVVVAGALVLFIGASSGQSAPDRGALRTRGKTIYETHCARCHGNDGADTQIYPGIKTLVDITQRMRMREALDKSKGFAGVALEGEEGEALFAYLDTFRAGRYARPELLVEPSWVELHAADPDVRVVDLRAAAAYGMGHVPGAVRLDGGLLRSGEDPETYLPSAATVSGWLRDAGINPNTHVVIYDDRGNVNAARLWYVLSAYGRERVSLINGGWSQWSAEKRPVSTAVPAVSPTAYPVKADARLGSPTSEVLKRRAGVAYLDARSPAENKSGRIPGAIHAEWLETVAGPHLRFRPAAELLKLYRDRGLTPEREIITYCAVGIRASHALFTLRLLGYDRARVYFGSWADYSKRPDAPVER